MTAWADLEQSEPEFAARVRALFDARRHKTLATLRRDGSPRISGIETQFRDGELCIGSMPGSLKGRDLKRDPRLALHVSSEDPRDDAPAEWAGDAKLAGVAVEAPPPPDAGPEGDYFRIDVTEVVLTRVAEQGDRLVIESWHPGRGLERRERA